MSHDTFIHRIVRPGVRLIAPTGVSPNQVTTARLLTGLAAATCFAQGGAVWMNVGAAVFIFSMLLDRADGELARQTGRSSRAGYLYDLACDCICSGATFIGLGIGQLGALGPISPWLGIAAGVGIGVLFWQINVSKMVSLRALRLFGGAFVADPDDAMLFVPILIWLGFAAPMLCVAAVTTPVACLAFSVKAAMTGARS